MLWYPDCGGYRRERKAKSEYRTQAPTGRWQSDGAKYLGQAALPGQNQWRPTGQGEALSKFGIELIGGLTCWQGLKSLPHREQVPANLRTGCAGRQMRLHLPGGRDIQGFIGKFRQQ